MSSQQTNIRRTSMQNTILDLEKKYFDILTNIVDSESFKDDLLTIEKEIRENYPRYRDVWNLKNKIKIPAERLVRHHIYTQLQDSIIGVYPSPISSDLGVMTDDCILCVDVKTLDTHGNAGDIDSTAVEPNQLSFQNTNHPYIQAASNLDSIDHYTRRPVLTYVIKIIYTDNNYSFRLSRENKPTLILTCIPNGELSNLFDFDIIQNFKTYSYYSEDDNPDYAFHVIPEGYRQPANRKREYAADFCVNTKHYQQVFIEFNNSRKPAYFDPVHRVTWWLTSEKNKPVIKAVKSGATTRLRNAFLEERYDSNNIAWTGYIERTIHEERA